MVGPGRGMASEFRGFTGHVKADAKSDPGTRLREADTFVAGRSRPVRGPTPAVAADGCVHVKVGCWYHARKRSWEAAVCKSQVGREGLPSRRAQVRVRALSVV
jgi:hypothetical protein